VSRATRCDFEKLVRYTRAAGYESAALFFFGFSGQTVDNEVKDKSDKSQTET
jgi:hypothetical protein